MVDHHIILGFCLNAGNMCPIQRPKTAVSQLKESMQDVCCGYLYSVQSCTVHDDAVAQSDCIQKRPNDDSCALQWYCQVLWHLPCRLNNATHSGQIHFLGSIDNRSVLAAASKLASTAC